MPRPKNPEGPTPKRNMRVEDSTWEPALHRARHEDNTTLTRVVQTRLDIYGHPLPDDAPTIDPWDIIMRITDGAIGSNANLGLAITAAEDLARVLGRRPERRATTTGISAELRQALADRLGVPNEPSATVRVDTDQVPYLQGLAHANVGGAAELADRILAHGPVDVWIAP